jgi:elongation factor 4
MTDIKKIRNFCIIAHIDHGKSTLADRLMEITGTIKKTVSGNKQVLDKLELEQERGITIKLAPVRMNWKDHQLNLIDTPWHVDFQYEVSRSLAAVEGAVLLIDASQGIQAQTLSVLYMAIEYGLEVLPVLNKIDLPAARPEIVAKEIETLLWIPFQDIICVSGKTGENVELLLDQIINKIPSPN